MNATHTPACALGLTQDDLSAWRDHALTASDERRITAHVASCLACQRTMAAHDTLADALRAERQPEPDARNWSRVQARIAGGASATPSVAPVARAWRWSRAAVWSGVGAVVAVAVLAALFVSVFGQLNQQRIVKMIPTATPLGPLTILRAAPPVASAALTWNVESAPESVVPPPGNQEYENGFAFSPTDPNTAYICATTNAAKAPNTIWVTHDGAKTWTHVSDIPSDSIYPVSVSQCSVVVDSANPLHVNVVLIEDNGAPEVRSEISDDGGKTWSLIPDDIILDDLVTHGSSSVALAYPLDNLLNPSGSIVNGMFIQSTTGRATRLMVSHDDWRTWQPIDSPLFDQNLRVSRIWVRPADSALLALVAPFETPPTATPGTPQAVTDATWVASYTTPPDQLWESRDMGAHWRKIPTPTNLATFQVAQPIGDEPWKICGFGAALGCTVDGGQTWVARPALAQIAQCVLECAHGEALLSDGSLFHWDYSGGSDPTKVVIHLFRLAQGSNQWQTHDYTTSGAEMIVAGGANATLIVYAGGGDGYNPYAGILVGQMAGPVANRGDFFFAALS